VDFEINKKHAVDLWKLSDQWLIQGLHTDCVEFLKQNMSLGNFWEIAKLAEKIGEEELFEAATDFGSKKNRELKEKHMENLRGSVLRKVISKCQREDLRKKEMKRMKGKSPLERLFMDWRKKINLRELEEERI